MRRDFTPCRKACSTASVTNPPCLRAIRSAIPPSANCIVWTPPGLEADAKACRSSWTSRAISSAALAHTNWKPVGENVPERLDRLDGRRHDARRRRVPGLLHQALRQPISEQRRLRPLRGLCLRRNRPDHREPSSNAAARAGAACSAKAPAATARPGMGCIAPISGSAIAINSGDMGFDALYHARLCSTTRIVLRKHDYSIEKYIWHVESQPKIKAASTSSMTLMDLAQSAFYDPDPTAIHAACGCRSIPTPANSFPNAGTIG